MNCAALNCPRVQESQSFRIQEPKVLLADEREAAEARPPAAEPAKKELAIADATPETEDAQAAARGAPWLVKEDHGPLALHLGVLDPEVECILIGGAIQVLLLGLGKYLLGRGIVIELKENDLAHAGLRRPNWEVPRVNVRVGMVVVASSHQLLGRAAVTDLGEPEDVLGDPDDRRDRVGDGIDRQLRLRRHERVDLLVGTPASLERLNETIREAGDPAGATHDCGHVLSHF